MMRRRFVVFAAPLATAALLFAGCAGSDDDATGAPRDDGSVTIETIQLAASNTQAAESTRYEIDLRSDVFDMHASGVVSGDGRTGQTVVESERGRIEQRMVDGVTYLDFGDTGLRGLAPTDGKRWIKLDLGGLADALGADPTGAFGPQTPGSALDMLRELSGDVEQVGKDMIAGHPAVHYRATIDAAGTSSPVDVWIDDQDRVVKMQLLMPEGAGELTMQITEFGVPVDVVAPPPEEVADMGDLFSDLLPDGLQRRDGIHI
jgi:hypothetical protein